MFEIAPLFKSYVVFLCKNLDYKPQSINDLMQTTAVCLHICEFFLGGGGIHPL